ncbi:hypothetical protein FRC05_001500 [Tulasnella sp. 425]|nr:hypothetical protein FRC05_001500 [Tulasnella sp. 425]
MHHTPDAIHPLSSSSDPFVQGGGFTSSFLNALVATALFRCWHLILFFSAWAAAVCLISDHIYNLSIQTTLITVFGTVLGFVISTRTSSSFERYNEGRRYWSSIVYGSRVLARTIWFHVPYVDVPQDKVAEMRAATLIEKKSAINLIEAFAVAVKHYLRGEESIYYEDLYQLVKFLPVYILPAGRPSLSLQESKTDERLVAASSASGLAARKVSHEVRSDSEYHDRDATLTSTQSYSDRYPPAPVLKTTSPTPIGTLSRNMSIDVEKANDTRNADLLSPTSHPGASQHSPKAGQVPPRGLHRRNTSTGTTALLPARDPPKYALFDVFPFSLFVKFMVKKGKEVKGKKGAKLKARTGNVNHNIPLEITFYLSSYISELQRRKILDVPTLTTLINSLNLLIDSLTGLERILTTPIPFSYSIHLWVVTAIFSFLLPFQLWASFKYLTIPATAIAAFVLFGFLVAGEEIENPFGYDKNDLNLDHFTHNIIRAELNALTSRSPPDMSEWAFNPENRNIFGGMEPGVTPQEWMTRGEEQMRSVLKRAEGR